VEKKDTGYVKMLGVDDELEWSMTNKGLKIEAPKEKPYKYAYTFKIFLER